ncbi:pyrroline-5-carboxylate reductase-like [Brevipalpus obovatus]|uniref:pyrroline-5-carboxylate reductase-like n=1 Tax=Brevipalpus obovatus TaxID=246614 RepID=UPI003D9E2BBF
MDLTNARIGFIGAGRICDAIIEGLTTFGNIKPEQIFVASPGQKKKAKLENYKSSKMNVSKRPFDVFAKWACDIIFLCFHGNVIKECLKDPDNPRAFLTNFIPRSKNRMYVLSLVSGCSVEQIKASLLNPEYPEKYQIKFHRIMINVACAYGLGLCAVDTDPDSKLSEIVRSLLSRIAKLEHVVGDQMDAACATAGYGLAFSYHFIDALAMAATKIGLDRAMATKFAAKTAQASGQTLIESGLPPDQMKDVLIAPGGAAIEGIHALEKTEFNSAISTAIEATFAKLQALSGGA